MATHPRHPAPIEFELTWYESRGSGPEGDSRRTGVSRTYRRTVEMSWIPEAGERVHLTGDGSVSVLVDILEWLVDGRPLVKLMPLEAADLPAWIASSDFKEI